MDKEPTNSNQPANEENEWDSLSDFENERNINDKTGKERTFSEMDVYPRKPGESSEDYGKRLKWMHEQTAKYQAEEAEKARIAAEEQAQKDYYASKFGQNELKEQEKYDRISDKLDQAVAEGHMTEEHANKLMEQQLDRAVGNIDDYRQDYADRQTVGPAEDQKNFEEWFKKRNTGETTDEENGDNKELLKELLIEDDKESDENADDNSEEEAEEEESEEDEEEDEEEEESDEEESDEEESEEEDAEDEESDEEESEDEESEEEEEDEEEESEDNETEIDAEKKNEILGGVYDICQQIVESGHADPKLLEGVYNVCKGLVDIGYMTPKELEFITSSLGSINKHNNEPTNNPENKPSNSSEAPSVPLPEQKERVPEEAAIMQQRGKKTLSPLQRAGLRRAYHARVETFMDSNDSTAESTPSTEEQSHSPANPDGATGPNRQSGEANSGGGERSNQTSAEADKSSKAEEIKQKLDRFDKVHADIQKTLENYEKGDPRELYRRYALLQDEIRKSIDRREAEAAGSEVANAYEDTVDKVRRATREAQAKADNENLENLIKKNAQNANSAESNPESAA